MRALAAELTFRVFCAVADLPRLFFCAFCPLQDVRQDTHAKKSEHFVEVYMIHLEKITEKNFIDASG